MWRRLAAGLFTCASGLAHAGGAIGSTATGELEAFLREVVAGEPRTPRHFSLELEPLSSSDGRHRVLPTVAIVAGRLGSELCLYQFRLETWSLTAAANDDEPSGGRSTVQQAPCDTLVDEVRTLTEYEVGSLRNRVARGTPRASNAERDALLAAAPEQAESYRAETGLGRVNVRVAPSLAARVRTQLAPRTPLRVTSTAQADWYRTADGRGYVHRSGLRQLQAEAPADPGPVASETVHASTGSAYVSVRTAPTYSGRVVTRLKPNSVLSLQAVADAEGWYRLDDGSGYVPAAALSLPNVGLVFAGATGVPLP
jgi:hypothetical protein